MGCLNWELPVNAAVQRAGKEELARVAADNRFVLPENPSLGQHRLLSCRERLALCRACRQVGIPESDLGEPPSGI